MARKISDWLEHYISLTENTESPTLYHLWSGITAISSVLQRKCYCDWGLRGLVYPNLYICLVGPPGGRKGTAMKIAKNMVQQLELPMGADSLGSTQALYREVINADASYIEQNGLPKNHKSLSIWSEEFQVFLSDRDPSLIASLTDLFDCADDWKYSTLKRGTENLSNCWLTIIGAITPSLLQSKLTQDAVGGGLISRIIFVVGYGAIKRIPLPHLTEKEILLRKNLIDDLQQISMLRGQFKMPTDFISTYARWYESITKDDGVPSEKFLGYNARRPLHLNKLCMILSASEDDSMILKPQHFDKALAILEMTEAEMINAFQGFGLGSHATVLAKVLGWIEQQDQFEHSDLIRRFAMDAMPNELSIFMDIAQQRGLVKSATTPTTTIYEVIPKKVVSKGNDYINKTLYRLLSSPLR